MRSLSVASFLARRLVTRSGWGLNVMAVLMIVLVYLNINFTSSLLNGFISTVNNKLISTQTGNIVVISKEDKAIKDSDRLIVDIKKIDGVDGVTGSRSLPVEITRGSEKTVAEVSGINPQNYGDVFVTPKNMIEGSFLDNNDKDSIVLGAQIAGADIPKLELYSDSLKNVHAGDKITVNYQNGVSKQYRVKGIFLNDFFESDLKSFITNDEFNIINPNTSEQSINVKLKRGTNEQSVIDSIADLRGDLDFRKWSERAGYVKGFTDTLIIVNRILRFVAFLVAAVTIFIVTYVDLVNKRRQIGIERAIGISSPTIMMSYMIRAFFFTIIGSAIGAGVFIVGVVPLERLYPFKIPYGKVFLTVDYKFMFIIAAVLIVIGLISALLPAWRTMRISIIDAIWGN